MSDDGARAGTGATGGEHVAPDDAQLQLRGRCHQARLEDALESAQSQRPQYCKYCSYVLLCFTIRKLRYIVKI